MSKIGRKIRWSCGRANRKLPGQNERLEAKKRFVYEEGRYDEVWLLTGKIRLSHEENELLSKRIAEREMRDDVLNFQRESDDRRCRLFSRVDPEYAMKTKDRVVFAKACDCGAVTVTNGHIHYHFLPRSLRRKRHEERVARREAVLREIAC